MLRGARRKPYQFDHDKKPMVTASAVMAKSQAPAGVNNYPENGLVKPPRRDTRDLGPAGMFGGNVNPMSMSEKGGLGGQSGKRGQGDCDWRLAVLMRRDRGLKTFIL